MNKKKVHKTHFSVVTELPTRIHPKHDPAWEKVGVATWRYVGQKRLRAGRKAGGKT